MRSMVRPKLQGCSCKNASSLKIEDKLLYYLKIETVSLVVCSKFKVHVHILMPRGSSYSQVLKDDIFVLWAIK